MLQVVKAYTFCIALGIYVSVFVFFSDLLLMLREGDFSNKGHVNTKEHALFLTNSSNFYNSLLKKIFV